MVFNENTSNNGSQFQSVQLNIHYNINQNNTQNETHNTNNDLIDVNYENEDENNDNMDIDLNITNNNFGNIDNLVNNLNELHMQTNNELVVFENCKKNNVNENKDNKKNGKNCVYTRTSTKKQSEEQHGLDYQQKLCDKFISDNNYNNKSNLDSDTSNNDTSNNDNNTDNIHDIGSSYNNEKKLSNLTKYVRKMGENTTIFVSEISRLGRNIWQVFDILKKISTKKSYVISVSEKLVFNYNKKMDTQFYYKVIDSINEADMISTRVTNAIKYIRANNGHVGRAPFGKKVIRDDKKIPRLVRNINEENIINKIINIYKKGNTVAKISEIINDNSDKPLSISLIRKIICDYKKSNANNSKTTNNNLRNKSNNNTVVMVDNKTKKNIEKIYTQYISNNKSLKSNKTLDSNKTLESNKILNLENTFDINDYDSDNINLVNHIQSMRYNTN